MSLPIKPISHYQNRENRSGMLPIPPLSSYRSPEMDWPNRALLDELNSLERTLPYVPGPESVPLRVRKAQIEREIAAKGLRRRDP